ncbi:MAG: TonB-dependent receptor plug domain-containing protein, partial [Asticcacaulis sp.]|nr:TonB-dependent receptor plug domain-containing protein [Asticcacaulis sp.]
MSRFSFHNIRRKRLPLLLLLTGSALGSILAAPSYSAEADDGDAAITEVVVQARRRTESVQRVPIAISTLSATQIEGSGAYRLDQLKQLVPSVQTLTFNPRNANVSIRGLGGNVSLTNDGLEQGVGFYVDDVYYGRPGQSQFDLVDLQQVEVLRGPQGTLFGKNTTAGAINIVTREPSSTFGGSLEATGGNLGYQQLKASITGPLIDGKLAFRASVAGTHRDGYIHNLHDGRDLAGYDNLTVRAQLLAT